MPDGVTFCRRRRRNQRNNASSIRVSNVRGTAIAAFAAVLRPPLPLSTVGAIEPLPGMAVSEGPVVEVPVVGESVGKACVDAVVDADAEAVEEVMVEVEVAVVVVVSVLVVDEDCGTGSVYSGGIAISALSHCSARYVHASSEALWLHSIEMQPAIEERKSLLLQQSGSDSHLPQALSFTAVWKHLVYTYGLEPLVSKRGDTHLLHNLIHSLQ